MSLSQQGKCELQWWCDNVVTAHNVISHVEAQHQITTDASLLGWGVEHDSASTGGELDPCGSPVPHKLPRNVGFILSLTNFC